MVGYILATFFALNIDDARSLCDSLNAGLGLTRENCVLMVAQSNDGESSVSMY